MHIRVMTDPQAYMRATVSRDAGAVSTELARQLITGKISAESQVAKAAGLAEGAAAAEGAESDGAARLKLSRWAPMMMLTGPCARIYDEVVQELVRARERAHEVRERTEFEWTRSSVSYRVLWGAYTGRRRGTRIHTHCK